MPSEDDMSFMDKARSLGFSRKRGQSVTTPVVGDEGPYRGQVVGKTVEHWDGRKDATVTKPFVTHGLNKKGHS